MASSHLSMMVRQMSTSGVTAQMVKAPLQVFGLEGRYATALYSAATKLKQLDAVEKELLKFQGTMKTDAKLREFVENPTYKRKLKSQALKSIGDKTAMSPATSNLLQLLADNGRLRKLDNVINAFKMIMAAHRGEVTCEVITAKELDPTQRKQLEDSLKKFVKGKESIQLTTKVDPALIGGMIVSIGDKYVDMSVASKIKKYTEIISATV
ncbi:ATP synthase oligomycin sensitivity conferring protein [Carabus blaptoides fortunei]